MKNGRAEAAAPRDGDRLPGIGLVEAVEPNSAGTNAEDMARKRNRFKHKSAVQCRLSVMVDDIKVDGLCTALDEQGR